MENDMTTATKPTLATLSDHGRRLKAAGYLPANFPELVRVRPAMPEDNVAASFKFVAEDYDGQGVTALKAEDFRVIA
jgi:hypothetical protein